MNLPQLDGEVTKVMEMLMQTVGVKLSRGSSAGFATNFLSGRCDISNVSSGMRCVSCLLLLMSLLALLA